jgi:plastocyanin
MLSALFLVAVAVSQATAATIRVDVGRALTFNPKSITAAVGDVLEFHFLGGEHDVARGDFNKPCEPAASGGFYSGVFRPTGGESPDVFRVPVTDTDPMFFYCSVEFHCSGGMVGVVNPSSGQTLEAYESAAISAIEVSPASPFGGQLGPAGSFTESDSGSDSGSSPESGSDSSSPTGGTSGSPTGSSKPTQSSPISVSGGSSAPGALGIAKAALAGILSIAALAMF